jgi:hypothetical protein
MSQCDQSISYSFEQGRKGIPEKGSRLGMHMLISIRLSPKMHMNTFTDHFDIALLILDQMYVTATLIALHYTAMHRHFSQSNIKLPIARCMLIQ